MTPITHYGQTLTEDTLQSACHQAALGHPDVPMALHPMDGGQWLTELIDTVQGTPTEAAVDNALAAILDAGGEHVLDVLASVAESRPGHVPTNPLIAKLTSQGGAPATLARAIRGVILTGNGGYTQDLRRLASDAEAREALAVVYLIHDHAWAMEQLSSWFTGDASEDRSLLLGLMSPLSRGELNALSQEAATASSPLPPAVAEQITAYAHEMADRPFFASRGEAVRWSGTSAD